MQDMAFPRVQFSKIFAGEHSGSMLPEPPIGNSCIRGWQSACFSSTFSGLMLNVHASYKKRMMIPSLYEGEVWAPKELHMYKTRLSCHWENHEVNGCSWILNLEKIHVGIMKHWGKNDLNHEYQDSNDSASTTDCLWWQQRLRISIINFNSKEVRPLN